jgi:WD40 repeat protein
MTARAASRLVLALLLMGSPVVHADPLSAGAVVRLGTVRLRPGGSVERLSFSPDGTKLVSWSGILYVTDTFDVWDAKSGELLRRVELSGAKLLTLGWTADSHGVALLDTGDVSASPLVWEFTDPKSNPKISAKARFGIVQARVGDDESDSCYALSPDGKTLAIGRSGKLDRPRPIRLHPLRFGVRVNELPAAKELARQPGNCGRLLFTPSGKHLVAFNAAKDLGRGREEDQQLVVAWEVATGKELTRFTAPRPAANGDRAAVAVSEALLAIGREDGSTSLWDLATGKERRIASKHVGKAKGQGYGTFAVAFSPDGKHLATGGRDGKVKWWDVAGGKLLHTLERHYSWVEALAVAPDGRTIASAGQDGVIRLWDSASGADACPQPGHSESISRATFSPDGRTALTAGRDHSIRWWDADTGRELRAINLPGALEGLAVSPDGRTVLATVFEERMRTWDLATGRETTPADLPKDLKVGALVFTPDGRKLISASGPHISVWDWPGLKLARSFDLPKPAKEPGENQCISLTVSPDGRWLVTVAYRSWYREEKGLRYGYAADGVVDVWDLATGKRLHRLAEAQTTYQSASFTADGRLVLAGGGGYIPAQGGRPAQEIKGQMCLLDPIAARWLRPFVGSPRPTGPNQMMFVGGGVTCLAPDGRTLYVGYNNGQIGGFEVATGQLRRTLSGHRSHLWTLSFRADGRRLLAAGQESSALVWDVTLAGAARPRKEPVSAADAEKFWQTATSQDAVAAFAALAELAAAPDRAVALLRKQLKPVPAGPGDADLDRVFANLDSSEFAIREKAARDLMAFGESAVPGVRKRMGQGVSLEVRTRAREFLEKFDLKELSLERLHQIRAVELLEGIATPGARALLTSLAKGAAAAPLTVEAATALARLERLTPDP